MDVVDVSDNNDNDNDNDDDDDDDYDDDCQNFALQAARMYRRVLSLDPLSLGPYLGTPSFHIPSPLYTPSSI